MVAPRLVMMEGVPGAGKSTLADLLIEWTRDIRVPADHVPEQAIFTRAEFAAVGQAFRTKTFPTCEMMLEAYGRVFANAQRHGASVIADWSAVGMIEDLPWAQPDRTSVTSDDPSAQADFDVLVTHARRVRTAWRHKAVLLVLELPMIEAIERAARERGRAWIERELARFGGRTGPEDALEVIADGHRAYEARNAAIIRAHEDAGWSVASVNARRRSSLVLSEAIARAFPDA